MRRLWAIISAALIAVPLVAIGNAAPQVVLATPGSAGSNGGAIERFTMRFSEAMVPLGDPRATPPAKLSCPVGANGRWVDTQTFVYDFEKALPGGLTCTVDLVDNLVSARGAQVEGAKSFTIDTGGPSARGVLSGNDSNIEEEQVFLVATNVAPTAASVGANAYCAVDGIGEKIAVDVLKPEVAATILDGLGEDNWQLRNFLEQAGQPQKLPTDAADRARVLSTIVPVKCRRPLPAGRDVALVWDAGIASADGRTAGRLQRFDFTVRKAFEARWECSRVNPQAGCNPVSDAHVRFAAPIPMAQAKATRDDFKPVLMWKGRVTLDANGHARIPVALSDALSSFKMVAIATSGPNLFGTGMATVRTSQDLQLFSALPPLVRTGDFFGASFTLRNSSDKPMRVTATVKVNPGIANGKPLTVDLAPGSAQAVTWNLTVPEGLSKLNWTVEAKSADGRAIDRVAVSQDIVPAVPFEVWAATLARVGTGGPIPITPPAGALPGSYVDVKLSDSLAPPLAGVRAYMTAYPYNCFEQQLSRAVVLGDTAAWGTLAGAIPTYQDGDGLIRYFPGEWPGSEALTAYALSMTAEAGFAMPDAAKGRAIEALKAVIEGRLKRDAYGPVDNRLLKVASLAALARNGASTPALLGAIDIAPADMPTGALSDWMVAIDRTPGLKNASALRSTAEATLRRRLVYEGTRIDLTDASTAPWWMMVSGDEMVLKALGAVLGRPGWDNEGPKMMVGVALRQRRGSWDTTPANAWGTVVARRFAALYPASAVTGTTTVGLGGVSRTQGWPMAATAAALRLPAVAGPLTLAQSGGAGPWANVSVSAAVPLVQPLYAGYRMAKTTEMVSQKVKGRLTRGDVMKVTISVDATADRNWVVVSDPVPPGATIVGSLGGQSSILGNLTGGEGIQPSYVERGRDAWRGYFQWVPRGRFTISYVVRLNGVGRFGLPPTRVEAMYSPEIRAALPNKGIEVGP